MSTKTKSYPNPVLGNGDDYRIEINKETIVGFGEVKKDKSNFYCDVNLNFDDDIILNLIKEEKAAFLCDIDCVKTNYRASEYAFDNKIPLKIPRSKVVDNVDINCYIVAMSAIENYTHPEFNEMFDGASFSLEEGDFIATLGSHFFNATVKYNRCPAPSSLIQVQRASLESGISKITFTSDDDRIYIVMPDDQFIIYNSVFGQNSNAGNIFISTIVVDALAYALMTLREDTTKLAENLRNLLETNNISIEEGHPEQCFTAARRLLVEDGIDPYTSFMKNVQAIITSINSQDNGITA